MTQQMKILLWNVPCSREYKYPPRMAASSRECVNVIQTGRIFSRVLVPFAARVLVQINQLF